MTPRKIKRRRGLILGPAELISIKYEKKLQQDKKTLEKNEENFPLTEVDRLTKVYKRDQSGEISEITCVSLEIRIKEEWVTIVYYDSFHSGLLHRHVTLSMIDRSDSPTTEGVRKNGTQRELLTWAIKDIVKNYFHYKHRFFKRSKIPFKDTVDMQYQ